MFLDVVGFGRTEVLNKIGEFLWLDLYQVE